MFRCMVFNALCVVTPLRQPSSPPKGETLEELLRQGAWGAFIPAFSPVPGTPPGEPPAFLRAWGRRAPLSLQVQATSRNRVLIGAEETSDFITRKKGALWSGVSCKGLGLDSEWPG